MSVMPNVMYDNLNQDSFVPTSMHLHLVDQSIRHPIGIAEDISVKLRSSFILVDFVVLEMEVCNQTPLILWRPFPSTAGAMIDVAAGIIKVNINGMEETFTFKMKGTEQCHQVRFTNGLERDAMTPDKKASAAENFSMKSTRYVNNATLAVTSSQSHRQPKSLGMETVLLTNLKCDALIGRINW
jgi:hypothetical protein